MPAALTSASFSIPGGDGYPLRGDVTYREGAMSPPPAVVVCHGFKGFKDWGFFPTLAEELAHSGYMAVKFNLSGSGVGEDPDRFDEVERFERATVSADLLDLRAIIDATLGGELPGPRPRGGRVGLLGHSRGGGTCLIQSAEDDRVACLATWASIATFDRYDAAERALWRQHGYLEVVNSRTKQVFKLRTDLLDDIESNRVRFDLVRLVRQLTVPYLIVHGSIDESVPISDAEELSTWAPPRQTSYRPIEGAGHTFGAVHPFKERTPELDMVLAETTGFLLRHLPLTKTS